jgi:polysaccharide export outer membrane protein
LLGLLPLAVVQLQAAAQDADYQIQPGDVLIVSIWGEQDMLQEVVVRPDGKFSYPLAGDIAASGHTVDDVREQVVAHIAEFIPDPAVTVQVRQIVGNNVYVLGQVNRPGMFVMTGPTDVMQALAMAGGTSTFADLNKIRVLRRDNGAQRAIRFDYKDVADGEDLSQNIVLQPGDVVVVP